MPNQAETFFRGQFQTTSPIVADAYFRSVVGGGGLALAVDAMLAKDYDIAITDTRMHCVETRAPATKQPLYEAKRVWSRPRDELLAWVEDKELWLEFEDKTLVLELWLSNRHFPSQAHLLTAILPQDQMTAARRDQRTQRWLWLAAVLLFAGIFIYTFAF